MSDHAFLSCSGAGAWVPCAAYPSVSMQFPEDEDSEDALRGTAAHWLLEHQLGYFKAWLTRDETPMLGTTAPNGIVIDQEIIDGVNEAVNDVINVIGDRAYLWKTTYLELPLEVKRVHPEKCWGTADIIIVDEKLNRIYVLDFKFGHVYVEPWFNWQLMLYAIGAIDCFYPEGDQGVTLHIDTLQPRSFSSTKSEPWKLLATDLRGYANQASSAAEAALIENPIATTGSHCKYCSGRHACSAYTRAVENCLDFSEQSTVTIPSAEAVGVELQMIDRALEILEARRIAAGVHAEYLMASGSNVPGYEMKGGVSALKWHKSTSEVLAMGKLVGEDLSKPTSCITPTQAIAKGVDAQLVKRYAEKKPTGYKLKKYNNVNTLKIFKRGTLV